MTSFATLLALLFLDNATLGAFSTPILLAGGGFKHGEHKEYPQEARRRVPLSNLYVSLLQRFGVETERFSMATGTLSGLEVG